MSRAFTVVVLVGALLVGATVNASAEDAAELEIYLERAEMSAYSGNELVVTVLEDETVGDIYSVNYSRGMMAVGDAGSMVGSGKAMADGGTSSAEVMRWSAGTISDRYSIGQISAVRRLGRSATMVEVMEGSLMRARITFDDFTHAPMTTEVFNGTGNLFRFSTMLTFDENPVPPATSIAGGDYDVLMPADSGVLPSDVGGYRSVDAYTGPDEALHVFYADGLFSFSVFVIDGELKIPARATTFVSDEASYRRITTPGDIWVFWQGARDAYVLVGDLPPDHLSDVLADLPAPESQGLFKRVWRRLFG